MPEIGWVDEMVERKEGEEVDARKKEQQGLVNGCHKFEAGSPICLHGGYRTHMGEISQGVYFPQILSLFLQL